MHLQLVNWGWFVLLDVMHLLHIGTMVLLLDLTLGDAILDILGAF
jgi:hypothetical protein